MVTLVADLSFNRKPDLTPSPSYLWETWLSVKRHNKSVSYLYLEFRFDLPRGHDDYYDSCQRHQHPKKAEGERWLMGGGTCASAQHFDTASRQRPPLDVCCYTFRLFWSISRHLGWPLIDTGLHCESSAWNDLRTERPCVPYKIGRVRGFWVTLANKAWRWTSCIFHMSIKHPTITVLKELSKLENPERFWCATPVVTTAPPVSTPHLHHML